MAMTDYEMRKYAAKAAEIALTEHIGISKDYFADANTGKEWDPLEDDGDALRLAVRLMEFEPYQSRGYLPCIQSDVAATRRAITRAAAEIGMGIPQPPASDDLPEDNYYKTQAEAFGHTQEGQ
jgi:hypothetical protein